MLSEFVKVFNYVFSCPFFLSLFYFLATPRPPKEAPQFSGVSTRLTTGRQCVLIK